jgi:hypothetical protein
MWQATKNLTVTDMPFDFKKVDSDASERKLYVGQIVTYWSIPVTREV